MFNEKSDFILQELGDSLILEAMAGNLPAVRQLIVRGADINYANINAITPLMAAAQWRRLDVVSFLLDNGAGTTALDASNGRTALMHACLSGSPQCVRLLLKAGVEVNAKDGFSMTALMMAATTGELDMVRCLVHAGADIRSQDEWGYTALDWAAKWKREAIVKYISSTVSRAAGSGTR